MQDNFQKTQFACYPPTIWYEIVDLLMNDREVLTQLKENAIQQRCKSGV